MHVTPVDDILRNIGNGGIIKLGCLDKHLSY